MEAAAYFRILIPDFQLKAKPLYDVLRGKRPRFFWDKAQQTAFAQLKEMLASDLVVLPLDYSEEPLVIIVVVDASDTGWGAVLLQVRKGIRHAARYESGI